MKADVHLREALRVVSDAVRLGRNRETWAHNRPPLTAATAPAALSPAKPRG